MIRVTTADIARKLGVSRPTVSSVLSGAKTNTAVSDELRARIVETAAAMGYRPNAAASAVRNGRFNSVALVAGKGSSTSTLPQALLFRLTDGLAAHGLQLVVARLSDEALTDERLLPLFLRQHSCDGLLLNYTHRVPHGVRDLIDRYRIPSIWINVKQSHDCVHPDDFDAARRATRWLIERGHRRIAYLDTLASPAVASEEAHYSVADRKAGYHAAMRDAGLPATPQPTQAVTPGLAHVEALCRCLRAADRPTAMLAYGGGESAAYIAALRLGLSVPGDLELVGFGDHVVSVGGVPLPTMRIQLADVAASAVAAILAKIAAPAAHQPAVAVPYDPQPVTEDLATVPSSPNTVSIATGRDPGPGLATGSPQPEMSLRNDATRQARGVGSMHTGNLS
jgi:LacI family transcriptional regulator